MTVYQLRPTIAEITVQHFEQSKRVCLFLGPAGNGDVFNEIRMYYVSLVTRLDK